MIISKEELNHFFNADYAQPHDRLGMHLVVDHQKIIGLVVRAYLKNAKTCSVVSSETHQCFPMERLDPSGFFECFIPSCQQTFPYLLRIETFQNVFIERHDPYRFLPSLSPFDLYLFGQGKHHRIYECMGANPRVLQGVSGTTFSVWAPNAHRVSVVGDFNEWDGRYHPMRLMGNSGVWELFIPELPPHTKYKFEIIGPHHETLLKSDPYGAAFEPPPNNASITYPLQHHVWKDDVWMSKRSSFSPQTSPISIYEVHLGSWSRVPEENNRTLSYPEIAQKLSQYVKKMGFTHVELMPISEFPFDGSWGYQVTGFYAPTYRYGTPDDFKTFVEILHQNEIGVIIDWVPAHFPKDAFALAEFDGTALYEHQDKKQGYHAEWGTLVFNYGRHEVRNFLIGSALQWFKRYHIDGIRVDAVAAMLYLDYSRKEGEWIPNIYGGRENIAALEFLRELNNQIHTLFPGAITIAEESTSFSGVTRSTDYNGIGFDFKWNMGWMHDTLSYFSKDPIYRRYHHNQLTFAMLYQYSEHFIHALSHDEVVYGKGSLLHKMPGATIAEKARHLMTLLGYMWCWPGKKTLFMGGEFGQSNEWQYYQSLDWHLLQYPDHQQIQHFVADINQLYSHHRPLYEGDSDPRGFEWISCDDCENSVIAFLRKDKDGHCLLVVCNFTPVERRDYVIGAPIEGYWKEIFNSDSTRYGGMDRGNFGGLSTINRPSHGRPFALSLYLPPLAILVLSPETLPSRV